MLDASGKLDCGVRIGSCIAHGPCSLRWWVFGTAIIVVSFADVLSKPPRPQPKVHQLQLRTHKLSIFLTVLPSTTLEAIKADALSALASDVNQVESIPKVKSEDDFEVCRAVKDKGKVTGAYEVMDVSKQVREYNLAGWDTLYLQFRDAATGKHFFPLCFCPFFHSHVQLLQFPFRTFSNTHTIIVVEHRQTSTCRIHATFYRR